MNKSQKNILKASILVSMMMLSSVPAYGMHIAEGMLPANWSLIWSAIFLPFFVWGFLAIKKQCAGNNRIKMLLAMSGAYCFVLSALKMPSMVTASSSHPTGTGLGAILFGPAAMAVLGFIVLLFQAILLAHGGLTTLGANAFSMAVAGPFVGYGVYLLAKKCKAHKNVQVFLAAFVADLFTYAVTATQLALAFNNESVSFMQSWGKFMGIFAMTQIPLAIVEGILTVLVYNAIASLCSDELNTLCVTVK
ncbi:cobalt/nickel transport system permease protein [Hydrogenoanaerobacterium saccharovorans]|uniref:Cobalt transport protein CbiM n=1 Tax=Hydrogenoanaerobacterium saccharovorans TaxID=474960 RepID=A0A1H8A450_9FIRM|nr:cobalt/nickel transport system permease protein [Hydrogenoanaerobacterium saccharovorans]SEM65525.1 cobalt/nickel transport system permease protein [Hydrogenoanaerobacterium saccharovorans]